MSYEETTQCCTLCGGIVFVYLIIHQHIPLPTIQLTDLPQLWADMHVINHISTYKLAEKAKLLNKDVGYLLDMPTILAFSWFHSEAILMHVL